MTEGLDFIAIDFETATGKRAQIAQCSRHHIKHPYSMRRKQWL